MAVIFARTTKVTPSISNSAEQHVGGSDVAGKRRFAFAVITIYALWVVFVALHHECWRDEADVWLAARDMSPGELFRWLGGTGTPGLWYFLVMPLAKSGLPVISMTLLHVVFAISAAALILFASGFGRALKLLLVFSYYFSYEFAVISRSYVLTVLLLFLIAIVLNARTPRPVTLGLLLFLLFNANSHGFFIAGVISAVVLIDLIRRRGLSRRYVAGGLIAAGGGLLAFIQLLPPHNAHAPTAGQQWTVFADSFSQVFFPHVPAYLGFFLRHSHGLTWLAQGAFLGIRWFGAVLLLSILFQMRRNPAVMAIVSFSMIALFYIFVFHWYGGERHAGLLFALLIFGIWPNKSSLQSTTEIATRSVQSRRWVRLLFLATLVYSCATGLLWSVQDIRWEYSGGKAAARFIGDRGLSDVPIAANPGARCESLLPYLPGRKFWYVAREEYGSYVKWDRDWTFDYTLAQDQILARVHAQFGSGDHLLLLAGKPLVEPVQAGYVLIYEHPRRIFDSNAQDEDYFVYAPIGSPAAKLRVE